MKNRLNCGTCVVCFNEQGEILIVNRPKNINTFCLPGGKVEPGERIVDGAVREVFEETGVAIEAELLEQVYRNKCNGDGGDAFYDVTTFVYRNPINEAPGGCEEALTPVFNDGEALLSASPFSSYNKQALRKACELLEDDLFFEPNPWKQRCLDSLKKIIV